MPKLKSIRELFDQKGEVLAWIILTVAIACFALGLGDWPFVALVTLAVYLMKELHAFKVGPAGIEVDRDREDT